MSLMYWPPLGAEVPAVIVGPAIQESGATSELCQMKFGLCGALP